MKRVRIVQVLCPQRHCVVASVYESVDGEPIPEILPRVRQQVATMIEKGLMDPWCGLCRSRSWIYQDQPTGFGSMKEAMPHLEAEERRQASVREYLRISRS